MPPAAARARSFPGRRPVSVAAGRWRAGPRRPQGLHHGWCSIPCQL